MKPLDFNLGPYAHRYWSEVIRQDPKKDSLAENERQFRAFLDDSDVDAFLTAQGWRRDDFEARGGSRRRRWRPWRDWLHLHRGGSDSEEARRWNGDLGRFRHAAALPRASLDLCHEFGADIAVQRAFVEFLQTGTGEDDSTQREVKERRRRWRRAGRQRRL